MPDSTVSASAAATSLDRSDESATTALYRAAIGPVSTDYYLPIFTRFEAADRAGPSWNWSASLYTLNWMVFRKLWVAALVYAGVVAGAALLVFGIGRLMFQLTETVEAGLWVAFAVLTFVIPGVYGNALLHAQSRKKMARALAANPTMREACAMLNRQAGSRPRLIWLILANVALAVAAAGAYVAFPQAETPPPASQNVAAVRKLVVRPAAGLPLAPAPAVSAAVPVPAAAAISSAPIQPASSPPQAPPPALAASAPVPASAVSALAAAPAVPTTPAAVVTKAAASAPKASASAPVTAPHFYINVGLFANDVNARNAHTKLLDAGLAAFTQELKTPHGKRTRVRVGPFDAQSEADAAAGQIRALKLDAIVFQQ